MSQRSNKYGGVSSVDYLPLKNHVVLEGIRKSKSGIIIPNTANLDTEHYEQLKVVAIGPRAMEEGLEIGDSVTLDPRLTSYGIALPRELAGDKVLIEYEMTAIRGIIPKRALKRMEAESGKLTNQFTEGTKDSKKDISGSIIKPVGDA